MLIHVGMLIHVNMLIQHGRVLLLHVNMLLLHVNMHLNVSMIMHVNSMGLHGRVLLLHASCCAGPHLGKCQGHLSHGLAQPRRIHVNAAAASSSPCHVTPGGPVEDGGALVVRGAVVPKRVHLDQAQGQAVLALTVEREVMV